MIDSDSACWFVARTRRGQELAIRDRLEDLGIRNFVPVTETLKIRNGRRVKRMSPILPNMVFLQATKNMACSLANGHGLAVYYIIDRSTNRMLVVPDKQMDDFIRVVNEEPDSVELMDYHPQPGEKVRIATGRLAGVVGEVMSVENDTFLVLSVGSLLSARVKISRSCLMPLA